MLGVRRPAVTVAIGVLENAGLIQHRRGRIRITNRAGLEDAACECYSRVRARQKELLGF
jgi:Mn-dependent DtxR family transcriptional regulator